MPASIAPERESLHEYLTPRHRRGSTAMAGSAESIIPAASASSTR
ncbi:hypothetical protein MMSP_3594 [Mycobacterium sp. 012931]|nr:hypothetical protein MMSP_3594 [Mycobacterium sp. 012931]